MTKPIVSSLNSSAYFAAFCGKNSTTPPKSYALITADDRLKIWDCSNKKLTTDATPEDHLVQKSLCLAWISSKSSRKTTPLIAIGLESGAIRLYNTAQGEIIKTLSDASLSSSSVTALAYDDRLHRLYSATSDGWLCEWNLDDYSCARRWKGDSSSITSLALRDDILVSAGRNIMVWRTLEDSAPTLVVQFAGHTNDIRQILIVSNYLLSIADQDRVINIYSLDDDPKNSTRQPLVASLSLDSPPVFVDTFMDKDSLIVSAVTEDGQLFLFEPVMNSSTSSLSATKRSRKLAGSTAPQRPKSRVVFQHANATSHSGIHTSNINHCIPIIRVQLLKQHHRLYAFVAQGALQSPHFELVSLTDSDHQLSDVVIERSLENGTASSKNIEKSSAIADETLNLTVSTPAILNSAHFPLPSQKAHVKDQLNDGKTLADQLQALEVTTTNKTSTQPLKSNSLVRMLIQSLQSSDRQLLEQCLQTRDLSTIQRTIQLLPTSYVVTFLKELISRFQRKPTRAIGLILWIRAIITYHAAYLMSLPDFMKQVAPLYQTIDARLLNQPKLARLSGRLDLIMSQIILRKKDAEKPEDDIEEDKANGPLNVYDEEKAEQFLANRFYEDDEEDRSSDESNDEEYEDEDDDDDNDDSDASMNSEDEELDEEDDEEYDEDENDNEDMED